MLASKTYNVRESTISARRMRIRGKKSRTMGRGRATPLEEKNEVSWMHNNDREMGVGSN